MPASEDAPALDLDRYVPHLIGTLYNRMSAHASAEYRKEFGVGVVDWRVLSTLRLDPGASAAAITSVFEGDKAAVSRVLKHLTELGHVRFIASERDPRRKSWEPTATGAALHDALLARALEREAVLTTGIPNADLDVFFDVIHKRRANLRAMGEGGPSDE